MQLEDVSEELKRPRILLNAANIYKKSYSREKDLKRLIGKQFSSYPDHILKRLKKYEIDLENARKSGSAGYDMKLHIRVMTALLQEIYLRSKPRCKP